MSELICIGNATTAEPCTTRVTWCRSTQFAGDHHFCDEHARAEKDFGTVDATGGQFIWFWRDQITQTWMPATAQQLLIPNTVEMRVDKPFSVREFMDKARAAGHDAFGIANDPEAIAALEASKDVTSLAAAAKARELVNMPVDHHMRAPNQPSEATIVEGEFDSPVPYLDPVPYLVKLVRKHPGNVEFTLTINGKICGRMPFDNLVKAATRIDPDHAIGTEKQIQMLRRETAEAKAQMYDWQAKALQLEKHVQQLEVRLVDPDEKPLRRAAELLAERNGQIDRLHEHVMQLEERLRAFQEASKA